MNVLEKFYGKDSELSVLFQKYLTHINTVRNFYKEKCEARFNDYRRINTGIFVKNISSKMSSLPVSKELAKLDKTNLLVSIDYNSVYPSAMAHLESK